MSKIEVLVTTMYQSDFSKYTEMNLQTDAVIANQADDNFTEEKTINNAKVKLVTTNTRGLSKNRNIALENLSDDAEFIMFADDDLKFYDGYEETILKEFEMHPEAQAIKFNLNCISDRKISMKAIARFKKATRKEVTSYGVWGMAIKKNVILKSNLKFNERFGAGTENYCGEDSIFLQELFKKGVSLYVSPNYIAEIDQSNSSWFEGNTEKKFVVSGMIINECYPAFSYLLVLRSAVKAYKRGNTELSLLKIIKCYYKGIFQNIRERSQ